MVESSDSVKITPHIPVYIVIGDSGAGKSTFINCLLGCDVAFAPLENSSGESVTWEPQIYRSDDPKYFIIESKGTNDIINPGTTQSLLFTLLTDNTFPGYINGIIYIHDSNFFTRCHIKIRIKGL